MKERTTDADALDALARRYKMAGEHGEVNGGDMVDLVSQLLIDTGRTTTYTLATPANMRRFEEENPRAAEHVEAPRCIAYSPHTGEECSGSAGDYYQLPDETAIIDADGERMILIVKREYFLDALTGDVV